MEVAPALYVFDACSLLNLVASRRFVDIAQAAQARFVTSELAAGEVRYVRKGASNPEEREEVDLVPFQKAGLLTILPVETPAEVAEFVQFAAEMDDGEAASCALAVQRGGILVTDDRKAWRVMGRRWPGTRILTTAEVIKQWADQTRLEAPDLARVLRDVEERARFRPGRRDPLRGWWETNRGQP